MAVDNGKVLLTLEKVTSSLEEKCSYCMNCNALVAPDEECKTGVVLIEAHKVISEAHGLVTVQPGEGGAA